MPVIEAVLTPAAPWTIAMGTIGGVEAYVDDGLGNPDTSYAGRTMLLVYNQDADAWDYEEPGVIHGDLYALVEPDGIARFPLISVSDGDGIAGSEVTMRAILEPNGTWTPHFTDDFFDIDDTLLSAHTPDTSPNPFTWNGSAGVMQARINLAKARIHNTSSSFNDWWGYGRDLSNPLNYSSCRMTMEVKPTRSSSTTFGHFCMIPNFNGSYRTESRWWMEQFMGDGSPCFYLYSDDSGWVVMRYSPAIVSGTTYEVDIQEIDGWHLMYVDGEFVIGQKVEVPSGQAEPYVENWVYTGGTVATMDYDNFSFDLYEDEPPPEPPVASAAYANILG